MDPPAYVYGASAPLLCLLMRHPMQMVGRYAAALDTLSEDPPRFRTRSPRRREAVSISLIMERTSTSGNSNSPTVSKGMPHTRRTAPHRKLVRRPGSTANRHCIALLFDHSIGRLCLGLIQRLGAQDCVVTCFDPRRCQTILSAEIASHVERTIVLPPDLDSARQAIATTEPDFVLPRDRNGSDGLFPGLCTPSTCSNRKLVIPLPPEYRR